jgi:integrase/recombinase XerC
MMAGTDWSTAVGDYLAHLATIGRAPVTLETYRITLTRAGRQMPTGLAATPEQLASWIAMVPSRNARAARWVCLHGFYRWCARTGRIATDPTANMEPTTPRRGLPRPVDDAVLAELLGSARWPDRGWIILALFAGLRCVEIARLDRADITQDAVRVRCGKGGRDRMVPTHPEVWAAFAAVPAGPVAGGRTTRVVSARIARECDRVGLPAVTGHRLRHSFATRVYRHTKDLLLVRDLLGHANVATTQIYAAADMDAARGAVAALSFGDQGGGR